MTQPTKQIRPGERTEADCRNNEVGTSNVRDLDAMAEHVNGALVLVVQTSEDRFRRRVYLAANAAERAARKAEERGHVARVYLARLVPVEEVSGHEDH